MTQMLTTQSQECPTSVSALVAQNGDARQLMFNFATELVVVVTATSSDAVSEADELICQSNLQNQTEVDRATLIQLDQTQLSEDYAIYNFTKVGPAANCRRSYILAYQPGLFAKHCLERTWGRIGSQKMRRLYQEFDSWEDALTALRKAVRRRLKRGYNFVG